MLAVSRWPVVLATLVVLISACSTTTTEGPAESVVGPAEPAGGAADADAGAGADEGSGEVEGRSLAEFEAPTSVLDSFSFESSMLDVEGDPFGGVSSGEFVMPDAVWCDAGNPAFVSSSMGVGTAIGDSFWFDDGFLGAEPDDRGGDNSQEWLEFCPGAAEYWEHPVFLDERFISTFEGSGDPIVAFDTYVYALGSNTDDLVVDQGRVWLTEAGWPIRVEITGSVIGGVFTFIDRDGELAEEGELSTEMVPFVIELTLSGFGGAQVVRAPDGSETVGPLGEAVASVPDTIPASGQLAGRMEDAGDTRCVMSDSLIEIIAGRDLETLQLSTVQTSAVDGNLTQTVSGMAGGGIGTQVTTRAQGEDALLHAEFLFNHWAPIAALSDWLGLVPPEIARDGELHISIADGTGEESTEIAAWNGTEIVYSDETAAEVSYHVYLAMPEPDLALTPTSEQQARSRLEDWTNAAFDAASGLRSGELQAALDLESLYRDLGDTKRLACTLLATAWTAADSAMTGGAADPALFVDEVAAQHTLLAIEYVAILGDYLHQPHIDWLRADNINLDTGLLAGDTTGTVLQFFSDLLAEALYYSNPTAFG